MGPFSRTTAQNLAFAVHGLPLSIASFKLDWPGAMSYITAAFLLRLIVSHLSSFCLCMLALQQTSSSSSQQSLHFASVGVGKSGWLCRAGCAAQAGVTRINTSCYMCSAPWQPRIANAPPSSIGGAEDGAGGGGGSAPQGLDDYSEVRVRTRA